MAEGQKTMSGNQPDWGTIAEKFDLWLPHIVPVGESLLQALGAGRASATSTLVRAPANRR